MENTPKRHLVTSALPYANGPLHIGHIAGAYLPADIYVRYLRLTGADVVYICGSDEHGAAITMRAKKEGVSPQQIVDKYHVINQQAFADFGISFDYYHRTSSPLHHETAAEFFLELHKKGVFEVKESEQYFDEEHQQFLADRYIMGTCPNCGNENAYGDQCEKCGSSLSPQDLINPRSVLSNKPPVLRATKHWYLPMEQEEGWLRSWIAKGLLDEKQHHDPADWRKSVVGQCMSWIDGGLAARAMTRDLDWGVPVPLKDAEGKVLYVWLDAPIGYISATKAWASEQGKNWEEYWRSEDSTLTHFIAKDNIVFHCIIFPILLKKHGGYNLPVNVPANEFLNLEGDKISTSREWAVWLHEYLEDFPGKKDELRYVLTGIAPEAKDSEFTWKEYQARINNELVAILGNFVNRSVVLTHKYFEGRIPWKGALQKVDEQVLAEISHIPNEVSSRLQNHKYREALTLAMGIARAGNKYLADTEPWKLIKTDPERVATILHIALDITARIATYLQPFLPNTSVKLANAFGWEVDQLGWPDVWEEPLQEGSEVQKLGLLFEKVEDAIIEKQVGKLTRPAEAESVAKPTKPTIDFDTFQSLDLRIGEVISAKAVPKANRLLHLHVAIGDTTREVVSGIAEYYSPEELTGKKVLMLLNLEPRKIRGVESQGMILMAENEQGALSFVVPEQNGFPSGSTVR